MKSLSHLCIALDFGDCVAEAKQHNSCQFSVMHESNFSIYATHTLNERKPGLNLQPFDYRQTLLLTGLTVR